jgi:Ferredoxin-like domain in Api92-like protein
MARRLMPNWVANRLAVTGTRPALERFAAAVCSVDDPGERSALDFERVVPLPAWLPRDRAPAWCRARWGTKWNALWPSLADDGDRLVYEFVTAWAPPSAWLAAAAAAHREVTLAHEFTDEYGQFSGRATWRAGELVAEQFLDPAHLGWTYDEVARFEA